MLDAPQTARNFMALATKGFFNGLQIHRVVPNFVVQDGDPRGDGEGGPGYTIRDELNERPYLRGTVGMALDWRDTGGSQFFITHSPQPHLDGRYTVFGHVVNGMDVVDRIQQGDVIERVRVWDGQGLAVGKTKGGDGRPLSCRRSGLPFLRGLLLPAFGRLLCHVLIPPSVLVLCRVGAHRVQRRRVLPARRPASSVPIASLQNSRDAGGEHQKKGVSTIDTPETGERPLALLRRLLLAALRSLLRHYSSLECGSSALLPVV